MGCTFSAKVDFARTKSGPFSRSLRGHDAPVKGHFWPFWTKLAKLGAPGPKMIKNDLSAR